MIPVYFKMIPVYFKMIPVYYKMITVYFKMIPENIHFFIFWPNNVEIENSKNMASLTYVPRYGIKQKKNFKI